MSPYFGTIIVSLVVIFSKCYADSATHTETPQDPFVVDVVADGFNGKPLLPSLTFLKEEYGKVIKTPVNNTIEKVSSSEKQLSNISNDNGTNNSLAEKVTQDNFSLKSTNDNSFISHDSQKSQNTDHMISAESPTIVVKKANILKVAINEGIEKKTNSSTTETTSQVKTEKKVEDKTETDAVTVISGISGEVIKEGVVKKSGGTGDLKTTENVAGVEGNTSPREGGTDSVVSKNFSDKENSTNQHSTYGRRPRPRKKTRHFNNKFRSSKNDTKSESVNLNSPNERNNTKPEMPKRTHTYHRTNHFKPKVAKIHNSGSHSAHKYKYVSLRNNRHTENLNDTTNSNSTVLDSESVEKNNNLTSNQLEDDHNRHPAIHRNFGSRHNYHKNHAKNNSTFSDLNTLSIKNNETKIDNATRETSTRNRHRFSTPHRYNFNNHPLSLKNKHILTPPTNASSNTDNEGNKTTGTFERFKHHQEMANQSTTGIPKKNETVENADHKSHMTENHKETTDEDDIVATTSVYERFRKHRPAPHMKPKLEDKLKSLEQNKTNTLQETKSNTTDHSGRTSIYDRLRKKYPHMHIKVEQHVKQNATILKSNEDQVENDNSTNKSVTVPHDRFGQNRPHMHIKSKIEPVKHNATVLKSIEDQVENDNSINKSVTEKHTNIYDRFGQNRPHMHIKPKGDQEVKQLENVLNNSTAVKSNETAQIHIDSSENQSVTETPTTTSIYDRFRKNRHYMHMKTPPKTSLRFETHNRTSMESNSTNFHNNNRNRFHLRPVHHISLKHNDSLTNNKKTETEETTENDNQQKYETYSIPKHHIITDQNVKKATEDVLEKGKLNTEGGVSNIQQRYETYINPRHHIIKNNKQNKEEIPDEGKLNTEGGVSNVQQRHETHINPRHHITEGGASHVQQKYETYINPRHHIIKNNEQNKEEIPEEGKLNTEGGVSDVQQRHETHINPRHHINEGGASNVQQRYETYINPRHHIIKNNKHNRGEISDEEQLNAEEGVSNSAQKYETYISPKHQTNKNIRIKTEESSDEEQLNVEQKYETYINPRLQAHKNTNKRIKEIPDEEHDISNQKPKTDENNSLQGSHYRYVVPNYHRNHHTQAKIEENLEYDDHDEEVEDPNSKTKTDANNSHKGSHSRYVVPNYQRNHHRKAKIEEKVEDDDYNERKTDEEVENPEDANQGHETYIKPRYHHTRPAHSSGETYISPQNYMKNYKKGSSNQHMHHSSGHNGVSHHRPYHSSSQEIGEIIDSKISETVQSGRRYHATNLEASDLEDGSLRLEDPNEKLQLLKRKSRENGSVNRSFSQSEEVKKENSLVPDKKLVEPKDSDTLFMEGDDLDDSLFETNNQEDDPTIFDSDEAGNSTDNPLEKVTINLPKSFISEVNEGPKTQQFEAFDPEPRGLANPSEIDHMQEYIDKRSDSEPELVTVDPDHWYGVSNATKDKRENNDTKTAEIPILVSRFSESDETNIKDEQKVNQTIVASPTNERNVSETNRIGNKETTIDKNKTENITTDITLPKPSANSPLKDPTSPKNAEKEFDKIKTPSSEVSTNSTLTGATTTKGIEEESKKITTPNHSVQNVSSTETAPRNSSSHIPTDAKNDTEKSNQTKFENPSASSKKNISSSIVETKEQHQLQAIITGSTAVNNKTNKVDNNTLEMPSLKKEENSTLTPVGPNIKLPPSNANVSKDYVSPTTVSPMKTNETNEEKNKTDENNKTNDEKSKTNEEKNKTNDEKNKTNEEKTSKLTIETNDTTTEKPINKTFIGDKSTVVLNFDDIDDESDDIDDERNKENNDTADTSTAVLPSNSSSSSSSTNSSEDAVELSANKPVQNEDSSEGIYIYKVKLKKKLGRNKTGNADTNKPIIIHKLIFGRNPNVTIEVKIKNESINVPSTVKIKEDLVNHTLHFNWTSNDKTKYRLTLNFTAKNDSEYYQIDTIQMEVLKDGNASVWMKNVTIQPKKDETADHVLTTVEVEKDVQVTFSNMAFMKMPDNAIKMEDARSSEEDSRERRIVHVEIGVGIIIVVILVAIIGFLVIRKMRIRAIKKHNKVPTVQESRI